MMGHEGCGAVKSAFLSEERLQNEPPHLKSLLLQIKSHMDEMRVMQIQSPRARDREAVIANTVEQLRRLHAVCNLTFPGRLFVFCVCWFCISLSLSLSLFVCVCPSIVWCACDETSRPIKYLVFLSFSLYCNLLCLCVTHRTRLLSQKLIQGN